LALGATHPRGCAPTPGLTGVAVAASIAGVGGPEDLRLGDLPPLPVRRVPVPDPDRLRSLLPPSLGGKIAALLLVLCAFGFLGFQLFASLDQEPFHGDESWWLFYGRFFRHAIHLDFANPEWTEEYGIDQPSLGKLTLGFAEWIAGKLDDLPRGRWDFIATPEWNEATGRLPRPDVLYVGRATSALFALLAAAAAFRIASRISGLFAGALTVGLLAANALFVRCGRRAMPDMEFLFFVLLGADFILRFVRRLNAEEWGKAAWMALGVAVCGFAATATKLNGAIVFAVFAAAGAYVFVHGLFSGSLEWPKSALALLSPVAAPAIGFFLFALVNPPVLESPIEGSRRMVSWRLQTASSQSLVDPSRVSDTGPPSLGDKAAMVWKRTLQGARSEGNFTTLGRADVFSFDFILFVVGLVALGASELVSWVSEKLPTARGVAVIFIAASLTATAYWLPVDWDRYYLLAIPAIALGCAFAPGELLRVSARLPRPVA
jgi:hypothetical protein